MDNELNQRLERIENLLTMSLLASGSSLPVTSVASVFSGDLIGTTDRYLDLYANSYQRMVSVKVVAEFAVPGATVDLSYQNSDNGKIDTLSSTGKVISDTIWLRPRQTLYINTADTVFSAAGSVFRVLLFDPMATFSLASQTRSQF